MSCGDFKQLFYHFFQFGHVFFLVLFFPGIRAVVWPFLRMCFPLDLAYDPMYFTCSADNPKLLEDMYHSHDLVHNSHKLIHLMIVETTPLHIVSLKLFQIECSKVCFLLARYHMYFIQPSLYFS